LIVGALVLLLLVGVSLALLRRVARLHREVMGSAA
jgi:CHASE3 domain sensor protein